MDGNLRILGAPSRYMQGRNALAELGAAVAELSRSCFIVADAVALDLLGEVVSGHLHASGVQVTFGRFGGECTRAEIVRQAGLAASSQCGVVIGLGGGKTIDTAKGVSLGLGLPIVIVPTIASNDSPTSRLIVVYDERHRIAEVRKLPRNPDMVLVDTSVIAAAPPRFLVAGIGDALSKKFEAEQCALTGALNFFGGRPTLTALALCDRCYTVIRRDGVDAVEAVGRGEVTESLENTVEAAVLLSGLGFESGGLALAHGLTRGLTAQPQAHGALHGELVAWGLVVQLIAEGRDVSFIDEMMDFYDRIGLPVRLADLGFENADDGVIGEIAEVTWREAPYVKHMVAPLSAEAIANSIRALENWRSGASDMAS